MITEKKYIIFKICTRMFFLNHFLTMTYKFITYPIPQFDIFDVTFRNFTRFVFIIMKMCIFFKLPICTY